MSSTFLEVTRATHEEVERLERLIVKDLQREPASGKERLHQNHRVRNMVDQIISNTQKLVEIYEDRDGSRKDEIAALGGNFPGSNSSSSSGSHNVFGAFYDRLKEIRDYHRRHPNARAVDFEDPEEILKEEPFIEFSGEEAFGRYLDLHEIYYEYVNSKFGRVVDYAGFLEEFPKTQNVDREKKLGKEYRNYLGLLLEYLVYFFERTQPLKDLGKIFGKVESDFEERGGKGLVEGWEDKGFGRKGEQDSGSEAIDLQYYDSVEDLMVLGPERLKEGLAALGLKSGGTLQQRAERLFLTKETPLEKLDRKHFAKGKNPPHVGRSQEELQGFKEVALMEAQLKYLVQELLHETLDETKANVEKKQALTYEEMEAEREEEEIQADTESDEEDQQIYNPLKLPLGFDGKPIPYWLYKLHGLGQEFKCEICGNHSYWGRRAFEKHFKEWRHQHGMKCLGIPNTKNFNEITSISEAKALWERIQDRQGLNKWRPDLQEEYEDQEGNVYNKKTYTDLQRQGLI